MDRFRNTTTTTTIKPQLTTTVITNVVSQSGFTYNELKQYSIILTFIICIGFICHIIVLFILIYQQLKNLFLNSEWGRNILSDTYNSSYTSSSNLNKNGALINQINEQQQQQQHTLETSYNYNNSKTSTALTNSKKKKKRSNKNVKDYSNYVTLAFVFHQTIVDLLRIAYCVLYASRIFYEYKKNSIDNNVNREDFLEDISENTNLYAFNKVYEKYCTQMASFYSVLTMVTIVNILTILISETCRFYDLKLNSSDTSNYCCVLFGIMLIWISSLIIISSLMLVGVADSAAPTWRCDLGESESTTRSLVINIVWFLLVAFVISISISYSISLYRELKSLGNEDNQLVLHTINASLMAVKPEFIERHIKIVKDTTKRLFILVILIVIFCFTFLPNFITTVLKNTIDTNIFSLRPYDVIGSIISLSNSSLNSLVLLFLCIKSNEAYPNVDNNNNNNNNEYTYREPLTLKQALSRILNRLFDSDSYRLSNSNQIDDVSVPLTPHELSKAKTTLVNTNDASSCVVICNEECIQLKNLSNSTNKLQQSTHSSATNINSSSLMVSPPNVKEFYSKIGTRLSDM